jgi:hypothetical protein
MPQEHPKRPAHSAPEAANATNNGKAHLTGRRHSVAGRHRELLPLGLVLVAIIVFAIGYGVGFKDTTFHTSWYMPLQSPSGAAEPVGMVQGGPLDTGGNTPLAVSVRGLPLLPAGARYALFLVGPGGTLFRCGDFVVGKGLTEVRLNFPGLVNRPFGWAVARETESGNAGKILLRAKRSLAGG